MSPDIYLGPQWWLVQLWWLSQQLLKPLLLLSPRKKGKEDKDSRPAADKQGTLGSRGSSAGDSWPGDTLDRSAGGSCSQGTGDRLGTRRGGHGSWCLNLTIYCVSCAVFCLLSLSFVFFFCLFLLSFSFVFFFVFCLCLLSFFVFLCLFLCDAKLRV